MRQSTSLCPPLESAIATSHSSLAQTSARHQSPEERHGPEAEIIFPRTVQGAFTLRALMRTGSPRDVRTSARQGGRKILKPITGSAGVSPALSAKREPLPTFFRILRFKLNLVIRKASGR